MDARDRIGPFQLMENSAANFIISGKIDSIKTTGGINDRMGAYSQ